MDDHTAAISCFQQALDIKQNDVTMYETRRLLGSSYLECDNYDDAVRTLEACLHFQETVKGNESEEWVSIAYDLATAKINSSTNIDEALSLLEQCIVLSKQSGTADGRLANALFQYGQIINNSPDKADEALGHFEECLHIRRGFGNVMEISDVLFEIGAIHESKKQYRATLESYQESLALRQSIDAQDERTADLLYRTGEVQRLSGKLDKAFNNITIALGAYYMSVGKNHRKVADTFHSLGYICGESFINYFPAIMNSIQ